MMDFVLTNRDVQLRKGVAMSNEKDQYEPVPKWLWMSVGVLMLTFIGGVGSLATWTLVTVVSHSTTLEGHNIRLSQVETSLQQININQEKILQKLDDLRKGP